MVAQRWTVSYFTWMDVSYSEYLIGSQNLTGRLIKFDDYCMLQQNTLPIAKRHTLKWVGITEEGVSAQLAY